jgi:hypothetical protein
MPTIRERLYGEPKIEYIMAPTDIEPEQQLEQLNKAIKPITRTKK